MPKSHSSLQENKGKFSPSIIQDEIIELSKYKTDKSYKEVIEKFIGRFDKKAPQVFKIGVGFWANSKFTIERIQQLEIDKLDYFIFIKSDQTSWKVFCTGKTKLFSVTEGKVDLPEVFEVKQVDDNQLALFEIAK